MSTSLHRGTIRTDLQRHLPWWQDAVLVRFFFTLVIDSYLLHSVIRCTRHHMARLHNSTARWRRLRQMPMESFSFRGHGLGNRIREP